MQQSVVVFRVADKEYGVPVEFVHSVEQGVSLTTVPRMVSFILGVFLLRGEVVPLVGMRERLGQVAHAEGDDQGFVLVTQVGGVKTGFLVDEVRDVIELDDALVEAAPSMIGGIEAEFIRGLVKLPAQVLILLDLEKLLSDAQIQQLKQLEESRQAQ